MILASAALLLAAACGSGPQVRYPVLYVDLDGTALERPRGTDAPVVRPATIEALRRYRACGGRVGIASGRTRSQVAPYLDSIQPNLPIALFNGAMVLDRDSGEVSTLATLPPVVVRRVLPSLDGANGVAAVFVQSAGRTLVTRGAPSAGKVAHLHDLSIDGELDPGIPVETPSLSDALKILVFATAGNLGSVESGLRRAVGADARVVVTNAEQGVVEVVPTGVDKASAIRAIGRTRGFAMRDVVAFGDSSNDVEMLREAGLGIAMGNCAPAACEAARLVVGRNDTDAIAQALEREVIGPGCPR